MFWLLWFVFASSGLKFVKNVIHIWAMNGPRMNSRPHIIVKIWVIWRKNANFGQKHSWFDDSFPFSSVCCTVETGPGPLTVYESISHNLSQKPDTFILDLFYVYAMFCIGIGFQNSKFWFYQLLNVSVKYMYNPYKKSLFSSPLNEIVI